MKKFLMRLFSIFAVLTVALALLFYFGAFKLVPYVLNSPYAKGKIENFIHKKTGANSVIKGFKAISAPNLHYTFLFDEISIKTADNKDALVIKDAVVSSRLHKVQNIDIKYLFVDKEAFSTLFKKKKSHKSFDIKALGNIKADEIYIVTEYEKFNFKDLMLKKEGKISRLSSVCDFKGAKLNIKGYFEDSKKQEVSIKGKNLPVKEIEKTLLAFQKSTDKSKKFLENFTNYDGKMDIDLTFKQGGVFGTCKCKNLSAVTVLFTAPVLFKNADFYFEGSSVHSVAFGTLAEEKVCHTLKITGLMDNSKREVFGSVKSRLAKKAAKYVPGLDIEGGADVLVEYFIKNKKIDVKYYLNLMPGSDIFYKDAYLGLKDRQRKLFVNTYKDGNNLYIKKYDYSYAGPPLGENSPALDKNSPPLAENSPKPAPKVAQNGKFTTIVSGDGLFVKRFDKKGAKEGHFKPKFLTAKTNGFAPASVTGSFNRLITGGEFSGSLRYDFPENLITGRFVIRHFLHKDFFVKMAEITADSGFINIKAEGRYRFEPFKCKIKAKNTLRDDIYIYNMELFLNKYIVRTAKNHPARRHKYANLKNANLRKKFKKVKDINLTVENWKILTGYIIKDKLCFENVEIKGSLKDDIFKFQTSKIGFAGGEMFADGEYNFKEKSSAIDFTAKNIDSNTASNLLFNLSNQIWGTADGNVHIVTKNKLEDIKANVEFKIDKGYLPKFGNREFVSKRGRKIKVSDITNLDTTNYEALNSNITGTFFMDNQKLNDIFLTSKQKYLSFIIEGNFDIESDYADLRMFGKYNAGAQKGLKILFIPLSFVVKIIFRPEDSFKLYKNEIKKIPPIEAKDEDIKYFRVKARGHLNGNDLDVETKSITR